LTRRETVAIGVGSEGLGVAVLVVARHVANLDISGKRAPVRVVAVIPRACDGVVPIAVAVRHSAVDAAAPIFILRARLAYGAR
jgi:hypothetical protein